MTTFTDFPNGITVGTELDVTGPAIFSDSVTFDGTISFSDSTLTLSGSADVTGLILFSNAVGMGFISNGTTNTYNGIAATTNGIYSSTSDFSITGNGSGSYVTFLSIDNSSTGGVSLLGRTGGVGVAAGYVGEVISANLSEGSAITLSDGVYSDVISITLTPGNWLVSLLSVVDLSGITSQTVTVIAGISTQSGNSSDMTSGVTATEYGVSSGAVDLAYTPMVIPPTTFYLTTTTTLYSKAQISNSTGSATAFGSLQAIRI